MQRLTQSTNDKPVPMNPILPLHIAWSVAMPIAVDYFELFYLGSDEASPPGGLLFQVKKIPAWVEQSWLDTLPSSDDPGLEVIL